MKFTYRRFLIVLALVSLAAIVLPFVVAAVHLYLGLAERLPNPEAGFMPFLEASAESLQFLRILLNALPFSLVVFLLSSTFLVANLVAGKSKCAK